MAETLKEVPIESIYEDAKWFQRGFGGERDSPDSWTIVHLVFLRKPDASADKCSQGDRAITLMLVMCVIVQMPNNTKGWGRLHVGLERGVECDHFQALVTNPSQTHREWQENWKETGWHGAHRYKTWYLASLDVKTAFDVAKPGFVAELQAETGVHGWIIAALLEETKDLKGMAVFEPCETEFRKSVCITQASLEAPTLG